MCKSEYSVEDFVLDPEFKKWVLNPDVETKTYWEEYLKKNPSKYQDIVLARKLLLNLSRKTKKVSEERVQDAWTNIEKSIDTMDSKEFIGSIIPMDSQSSLKKYAAPTRQAFVFDQFSKIAAILVLAFMLAISFKYIFQPKAILYSEIPIEYQEHIVSPGMKSSLTLVDGSKVILNSGSTMRYVKNFETHKREIELTGEAYFEVVKDPNRPFIVRTGKVSTQVLGTSFNIKAFENETLEVSLLTGEVEVAVDLEIPQKIRLTPGEALSFKAENQNIRKGQFDSNKVLAWTQKTIVFDQAQMVEVKRVLENWYGLEIRFMNQPARDLEISAKFKDQSLKDVLEGLSYSARFAFEIQNDRVNITFK
ncbi:FecR family protein [Arthrospiribacter ruber]|uniref:FecR family protein n=1 Tax=Arthrospiribacter ruber TaxID=2487934 RepID=A0A951IYK5_9BACT|nr:FecR family protein [Arthrospiribacter ruber]MBW3469535.1 FecR family protein [Arthrospiribacter ruber]